MDFGIVRDRAVWGILVNDPLDGNGNSRIQKGPRSRVLLGQCGQKGADGAPLQLDRIRAAREGLERPPETDAHHAQAGFAFSAARTRGADIGTVVIRTSAAAAIAFATVGRGGTMGVSPTPRTP